MQSNAEFRNKFYESYFAHQASRSGSGNLLEKMRDDHLHYKHELLPFLPVDRSAKIVEMACGYGSLLKFLTDLGYSPKGFDLSADQVGMANELGVSAEVLDIQDWIQGNDGPIDTLLAIDLIEHFDKSELLDLLIDIRSKIKSNGTFIARTPNMDGILPNQYAFGDFTHGALINSSSAIQLFKAAGFSSVEIHASCVKVRGVKEVLRSLTWGLVKLRARAQLFGSGRSTQGAIYTPNLIIIAKP